MSNTRGSSLWRYETFLAVLKIALSEKLFWSCLTVNALIDPSNIEDCNPLKSSNNAPQKVIMKLSKRKDVYHVLKAKSSFKNADVTVNGIPPNITVFVNQSICSYCKFLWSKYKKLWLNKVIESIWVSEDSYRITLKHDSVKIITHIEHLKCLVSWACNLGRKC